MSQEKIAILGTGMAGWGAVHRLHEEGISSVTYDKNEYFGGHTASFKHPSGFIFDEGPHVSFTKHERIKKLFADSVDEKYEKHEHGLAGSAVISRKTGRSVDRSGVEGNAARALC